MWWNICIDTQPIWIVVISTRIRNLSETFYMGVMVCQGIRHTQQKQSDFVIWKRIVSAGTFVCFELRYPLILEPSSTIYLLGFVEAGNAWSVILNKFNPFDLKRSAGFGYHATDDRTNGYRLGMDSTRSMDLVITCSFSIHFIIGQEF